MSIFGAISDHYVVSTGTGTYDSAVLADTPLLYFKMDETSGTSFADSSGNGQNGTWQVAPTLASTGATFDGSSNYGTFPVTTLPTGNAAYSVEYMMTPASVSGQHDIVDFGSNLTNQMSGNGTNGTTVWQYWNGSNVPTSGITIATGVEYHVAATYDGTTLKIYVNSTQYASATKSAHNLTETSGVIGRSLTGLQYYSGRLRRVAVYGTALSATRVSAHYAAR